MTKDIRKIIRTVLKENIELCRTRSQNRPLRKRIQEKRKLLDVQELFDALKITFTGLQKK